MNEHSHGKLQRLTDARTLSLVTNDTTRPTVLRDVRVNK